MCDFPLSKEIRKLALLSVLVKVVRLKDTFIYF